MIEAVDVTRSGVAIKGLTRQMDIPKTTINPIIKDDLGQSSKGHHSEACQIKTANIRRGTER